MGATNPDVVSLFISKINMNGGTQPRAQLQLELIQEYAAEMMTGAEFPPVTVFYDGTDYWLADGYHRVSAARVAGQTKVAAEIRQGSLDDAKWYSYGVNQAHGLRRTNEDKRRAVEAALAHPFARGRSNVEIARHCGVSHTFVNNLRSSCNGFKIDDSPVTVTRGNSTYTMNTTNIGRRKEPELEPVGDDEEVWNGCCDCRHWQSDRDEGWCTTLGRRTHPDLALCNMELWQSDSEDEPEPANTPAPPAPLPTISTIPEVNPEQPVSSHPVFNATNENIEWAAWSWNPVTGCLHGCNYCYARDIANRFYPEGFKPTFRPERLAAPHNTRLPAPRWPGDKGFRGVFVCSMADLFGEWVPQEWILAVLEAVGNAPQWNFIFLTKNPWRLATINWPKNAWVGATVDTQARVKATEEAMAEVNAPVRFVSCEPLLEPVRFSDDKLSWCNWLIIGAQSRCSTQPEFQPPWAWAEDLIWQARNSNCKVYLKPNFQNRPREYPGGGA